MIPLPSSRLGQIDCVLVLLRASPSTTRSRKPISSPKIITSRQAFASAVIGSPVLPSGGKSISSWCLRS
ncbi:hypothetical protein E1A91_A03G108200v1 [Gossypium mustelinum]|uniref:Uncharacterized protein n=1 Tax=Gossypium mustelinum TaxID=34275 RepID=A0A5D2ZUK5_GOSMU|nr:hypothetical protein E1A91_A03G108200v1 [Gossypium mustelinum]TYJ42742.1 hypothetical protein E1A91_A03G108200v1 [Gossypium mustelinum]